MSEIPLQTLSLQTPHGELTYRLQQSRRRSIMIRIEPDALINVRAPHSSRRSTIEGFLQEKSKWIFKKLKELETRPVFVPKISYQDGQEFLFLGKRHLFELKEDASLSASLSFDGEKWKVRTPSGLSPQERDQQIRERFLIWYSRQAKEILPGRIFHYARQMGVSPETIAVKTRKSVWGSCDFRKKSIQLNWQIIMTPWPVLDYVVVHELAHLTYPNHSKQFWAKVEQFFPRYQECRSWLKIHQREITTFP